MDNLIKTPVKVYVLILNYNSSQDTIQYVNCLQGQELVDRMEGGYLPDFYGSYLEERIAKARIILRNWASKKFTSDAVYREITYPSQQARLTEIDLI